MMCNKIIVQSSFTLAYHPQRTCLLMFFWFRKPKAIYMQYWDEKNKTRAEGYQVKHFREKSKSDFISCFLTTSKTHSICLSSACVSILRVTSIHIAQGYQDGVLGGLLFHSLHGTLFGSISISAISSRNTSYSCLALGNQQQVHEKLCSFLFCTELKTISL